MSVTTKADIPLVYLSVRDPHSNKSDSLDRPLSPPLVVARLGDKSPIGLLLNLLADENLASGDCKGAFWGLLLE